MLKEQKAKRKFQEPSHQDKPSLRTFLALIVEFHIEGVRDNDDVGEDTRN